MSNLLAKAIRLPLRLVPKLKPMPILSGPLAGRQWLSTSGTHGCWLGTYERELQILIAEAVGSADVFYDVGANVGFFSLLAAQRAHQVFSFEPLPENIDLLKRNLALNSASNVTVVAAAVSSSNGTSRFEVDGSRSEGHLSEDGLEVRTVALDLFNAPPPTVMKIDVEGAEFDVLNGAKRLLVEERPLIFLSTHGFVQQEACCSFLEALGYSLTTRRSGSSDGMYEVICQPPARP